MRLRWFAWVVALAVGAARCAAVASPRQTPAPRTAAPPSVAVLTQARPAVHMHGALDDPDALMQTLSFFEPGAEVWVATRPPNAPVPLPPGTLVVATRFSAPSGEPWKEQYVLETNVRAPADLDAYMQARLQAGWELVEGPTASSGSEPSPVLTWRLRHPERGLELQLTAWPASPRGWVRLEFLKEPRGLSHEGAGEPTQAQSLLPALSLPEDVDPLPPFYPLRGWFRAPLGADRLLRFRTADPDTVMASFARQLADQGWTPQEPVRGTLWGQAAWRMLAAPPASHPAAGLQVLVGHEQADTYFAWVWAWPELGRARPRSSPLAPGTVHGPSDPELLRKALQGLALCADAAESELWVRTEPEPWAQRLPRWPAARFSWLYAQRCLPTTASAQAERNEVWTGRLLAQGPLAATWEALDQALRTAGWEPLAAPEPEPVGFAREPAAPDTYCAPHAEKDRRGLVVQPVELVDGSVLITLYEAPMEACNPLARVTPAPQVDAPPLRLNPAQDATWVWQSGAFASTEATVHGIWTTETPLAEQCSRALEQMQSQGWRVRAQGQLGPGLCWLEAEHELAEWTARVSFMRLSPDPGLTFGLLILRVP
ncbi:MAG: hypothetical protein GXO36_04850 [Chloroflexi bacterium]|nr:hypothetical protein [Chloroflexota bacterium]